MKTCEPLLPGRRRVLAMLAATALPSSILHAAPEHTGRHAHGGAQYGTGAAVDADGRLWAVYRDVDNGATNLMLRISDDLGRSWSAPRALLAAPEPIAAGGDARPQIAFGPHGEIHVIYVMPIAPPHIGEIRYLRSTDGGRSFSAPITVHADRQRVTHGFASLLVDGRGRVIVAWIDGRDAAAAKAKGTPYAGSAVYYAVSRDHGARFDPEIALAEHSCECCRIALACDASGRAVALWRHVFDADLRDHALATIPDSGSAHMARASFDDWHVDACPHHGPALAYTDDGTRHQVWFNGREDTGGLMYAALRSKGGTLKPQRLGAADAAHGDVATHGRTVAIAWKELDGDGTAIRGRVSRDGGAVWRDLTLARTAGDSDQPRLVAGSRGIVLVWRTQREGLRSVAFDEAAK
ncbi:sialidase family protein [Noviherbaspirillum pedocola]|uniref:Exo-alpha-sialidase n=1 Tax=Noviherbaspirillum pedocola TaxID=2801341 RepID=A0A934W8G8_9BURK|nr:sialidase family protein [Noviherbaspirillum pedocola]MBK4735804.1 exo-alpha-sialidase [Noviherbaspirillum pedocola]